MEFLSVVAILSCPISVPNVDGRYFLADTIKFSIYATKVGKKGDNIYFCQMKKEQLLFAFQKTKSPVAYCVLSVGMGTRDEASKYNGLAHLTEHMLFKGTNNRSSVNISSTLEKVGGDLNAFTTKERIVLYSTTLKEDVKKAIELIFEVAFDSVFPADELQKEKTVIYDEIITYQDSPTELLFDTFENELFASTPLGYSILGEKKTLERITPQILKKNLGKFFRPENMTFSVAGNFDEEALKELIERELQRWRPNSFLKLCTEGEIGSLGSMAPITSRPFAKQKNSSITDGVLFNKQIDKNLRQAHCIIGCRAYSYYGAEKKVALSLLTNMLGGPASNSRLNLSLREKHALVYHVDASCVSYKDTGLFCIYFGCDKKYLDKCTALIKRELERFIEQPLSERALNAAKKQMIGQLSIAGDNAEARCLTIGKSMLLTGSPTSMEKMRKNIENVSAQMLQTVAKEVLRWERMSRLVFY